MKFDRYDNVIYEKLYQDLKEAQEMLSPFATRNKEALRTKHETFVVARPNFFMDGDRIINCRFYNRYADKTQVFSLYKNDDISRRILHVQIVSRIARNIGRMLRLNIDLIEAIALGHDLGHTPFGHAGERFLSELYYAHTGRYFNHNVHSVRILDQILQLNLSFQVLDGILCHNGERVSGEYRPTAYGQENAFEQLQARIEQCYMCEKGGEHLVPSTMEGCVVRLADIIAYLGKDRQDAMILGIELPEAFENNPVLGSSNAEFISNIITNVISNSYEQPYLKLDEQVAEALAHEKRANYNSIYALQDGKEPYPTIKEMFEEIYVRLLSDVQQHREDSPVFRHHIRHIFKGFRREEELKRDYLKEEPNQIVVDYIASMTDDYFIELHAHLFPHSKNIEYRSYFEKDEFRT